MSNIGSVMLIHAVSLKFLWLIFFIAQNKSETLGLGGRLQTILSYVISFFCIFNHQYFILLLLNSNDLKIFTAESTRVFTCNKIANKTMDTMLRTRFILKAKLSRRGFQTKLRQAFEKHQILWSIRVTNWYSVDYNWERNKSGDFVYDKNVAYAWINSCAPNYLHRYQSASQPILVFWK